MCLSLIILVGINPDKPFSILVRTPMAWPAQLPLSRWVHTYKHRCNGIQPVSKCTLTSFKKNSLAVIFSVIYTTRLFIYCINCTLTMHKHLTCCRRFHIFCLPCSVFSIFSPALEARIVIRLSLNTKHYPHYSFSTQTLHSPPLIHQTKSKNPLLLNTHSY